MASPTCTRCGQPVNDPSGAALQCPSCGGPIEDECVVCGKRDLRGEELRRCIGCGEWLCGRPQCSRDGYENLARRISGRTCATCARKREIVPRPGGGKALGSGAGIEAIERARYYLTEASDELEDRLRRLSTELADRISGLLEQRIAQLADQASAAARSSIAELEAATSRQLDGAAEKLGRALEESLARGLARGAGAARDHGRSLVGDLDTAVRGHRLPLVLIALAVLCANAALSVAIVLALR